MKPWEIIHYSQRSVLGCVDRKVADQRVGPPLNVWKRGKKQKRKEKWKERRKKTFPLDSHLLRTALRRNDLTLDFSRSSRLQLTAPNVQCWGVLTARSQANE